MSKLHMYKKSYQTTTQISVNNTMRKTKLNFNLAHVGYYLSSCFGIENHPPTELPENDGVSGNNVAGSFYRSKTFDVRGGWFKAKVWDSIFAII